MSGEQNKQSRREILEQSRRERAARQKQKRMEVASVNIQSFYRGRKDHRRKREEVRQQWDSNLVVLSKRCGSETSLSFDAFQLEEIVRQFLFFYSPRSDSQRLALVVQSLCKSICSATPVHNYCHRMFVGEANRQDRHMVWTSQTKKLALILLAKLKYVKPGDTVGSKFVLLLWLLVDPSRWPFMKEATGSVDDAVKRSQLSILRVLVIKGLFSSLRQTLLQLTSDFCPPTASSSPATVSVADKTTIALVVAIAMRPISLIAASSEPDAIVSGTSPCQQSANSGVLMGTDTQCSSTYASNSAIFTSFVQHIFSIPLLASRLGAVSLTTLINSLVRPTIWIGCLKAIPLSVPTGYSLSFTDWDNGPSSHPYPLAGWLLGNLLELHGKDKTHMSSFKDYLSALCAIIVQLPASAFPSDNKGAANFGVSRYTQHPLLVRQLGRFQQKAFLDLLCSQLMHAKNHVQRHACCPYNTSHACAICKQPVFRESIDKYIKS